MSKNKCPYNKNECTFVGQGNCPFPNEFKDSQCIYIIESPCVKCACKGSPYIGFGDPKSEVMVVGGSSIETHAELLQSKLAVVAHEVGLPFSYYYTTAVKCEVSKKPSIATIKKCSNLLKEEIAIIKPKYVLVLGETAFKALLWDFDLITRKKPVINQCAGSHIDKEGIIYLITYNLSDIENNRKLESNFVQNVARFIHFVNGKVSTPSINYKEIESEKEMQYILDVAATKGRVAVDIETNSLIPFLPDSEIISIAFSVEEHESFCTPISWRKGTYVKKWNYAPKINPFTAIIYINKLLKDDSITKIFHNAAFDVVWLEHLLSLSINNYDDTMLMKFLLNQNDQDRKGLKHLTKQYLPDMGYYEYGIQQYLGENSSYADIPPPLLMHYNSADTDATIRLWSILKKELKTHKLHDVHYKFILPKLRGIINLKKTGIALDTKHCIKMKDKEEQNLIELFSELKTLPHVANFEKETGLEFSPSSTKHIFAMVYGGEIVTANEVPRKIIKGKKVGKKLFEKVVYNGFNLKPITVSTRNIKTGLYEERKSFDKKTIQKYLKGIYKDIKYLDPINTFDLESLPNIQGNADIMKFIKCITAISSIKTQLSNHIKPFIDIWSKTTDACVHTSYDLTGTTTGRLACIAEGTEISFPDKINTCIGTKKIEEIRAGDEVYTFDDDNTCIVRKVLWAGRTGYSQCCTIMYELDGKTYELDTTYEHKIRLFDNAWKEAVTLKNGHTLLALGLDEYISAEIAIEAKVISVTQSTMCDVYNLEVEDTHRFIANGLCVKNSRAPNLQNLKRGGFVKEAFVSRWGDDGLLMEADYKQLELFVMAIVSQDPKFVHAFTHGIDLHMKTAAHTVFKCAEKDVTKQMRTMAKPVNFGIIYGKTAYSLKDDLNVSEDEAKRIIQSYFEEYAGVKEYLDKVKSFAQVNGYVITAMGRRRYIDRYDPGADRKAVNTTIQSPASDICITAIVLLQEYFRKVSETYTENKEANEPAPHLNNFVKTIDDVALVCGTVHDSIIIDCKKQFATEIAQATQLIMENTGLPFLTIPLKVDIKYGRTLRDMTEWDGESKIEI